MASACSRSRRGATSSCSRATGCEQHNPAIADAIADLPHRELILDGEVTGVWGPASTREADKPRGLAYHVFDVLWIDGRDVMSLPLDERRALLKTLPLRAPLRRVAALDDEKPWERACAEGWEGVIAKRRDSVYEHRRSPHWLKMKCEASQELVVGGFTDPQGARVGLGALLVGYFEKRRLRLRGQGRHRLRHQSCCSTCARSSIASRSTSLRSPRRQGCRVCARTG